MQGRELEIRPYYKAGSMDGTPPHENGSRNSGPGKKQKSLLFAQDSEQEKHLPGKTKC